MVNRHSSLVARKWGLFALSLLTGHRHAALRVAKKLHFRLAILRMSIGQRVRTPSEASANSVLLGSGPINYSFEASKWRRYRALAGAAGSIATRKAAKVRD